jgi:hypothetical protein
VLACATQIELVNRRVADKVHLLQPCKLGQSTMHMQEIYALKGGHYATPI